MDRQPGQQGPPGLPEKPAQPVLPGLPGHRDQSQSGQCRRRVEEAFEGPDRRQPDHEPGQERGDPGGARPAERGQPEGDQGNGQQAEADRTVLEQTPDRVGGAVDQDEDGDRHRPGRQQPVHAGHAKDAVAAGEDETGKDPVGQAQGAVAERQEFEDRREEVDRGNPVLRDRVDEQGAAGLDLADRADEKRPVELLNVGAEVVVETGRVFADPVDHHVRNRDQDQAEDDQVEDDTPGLPQMPEPHPHPAPGDKSRDQQADRQNRPVDLSEAAQTEHGDRDAGDPGQQCR